MEFYYSYQVDTNGNLFSVGRHWPNPPSQNDVVEGVTMFVTQTYYPDIQAGMRLDMQAGGFYAVDEFGNNIPESFVPFGG